MDDKSHVMKYHEVVPVDMSQYCFNVIDIKQEPVRNLFTFCSLDFR